MACTKEVSLITEVEFQLLEQHSAEGYINQALPTTFTIVPEDTLKNYEYTITYEILDGKGHFEDMDGNLLESGKGQSFPTNLISSLMYKGSKIGAHRIKIVGSDNFGLSEEIEITYNLSDVPVVWEASSELSELELDKPASLSLLLGTDNTAEDITYEAIYGFVPGPGILVPSQENGYVPTGEYNPIVAGNYPLVFTPSEVGPQQLTFTLRDSNGQEIETILDFNVIEFIDISSINLEPASANINVDETQNLELVITPANASNQNVSWSSSDETIATVDTTGLVTGISQGSVTIIASANDSSQVVGTASITVGSEDVALTGITVMPSPVSLNTGSTQQLTIDFEPANATNKNVTWSTSNPTKATVSNTGLVTTIEVGSVTITATSDADTSIFGNSAITINEINNGPIAVDDDYTVVETGNLNVFILTNDTDDENNDLTVNRINGSQANVGQAVSGSAGGLFTITGGGNLIFDTNNAFDDLNNGENRTTTISYGITDGNSNSNNATVTITVTGVNDINNAPVAVNDNFTIVENAVLNGNVLEDNGSGPDFDLDNETLVISKVNDSEALIGQTVNASNGGQLSITSDGAIVFNQNGEFDDLNDGESRQTSVTYQITDSNAFSNTTVITVTVTGIGSVNIAPSAMGTASPLTGNAPLTVNFKNLNSTDDDGMIISTRYDFGDTTSNNGGFPFATNHTYTVTGTYIARMTVTDNDGATSFVEFEIVVTDPPAQTVSFSNGSSVNPGAAGTFVQGTLTISPGPDTRFQMNLNGGGALSPEGSELTFTVDGISYFLNAGPGENETRLTDPITAGTHNYSLELITSGGDGYGSVNGILP